MKSFKLKMMVILLIAIIVSNAGNLLFTLSGAEKEVLSKTESYMEDITVLCGSKIESSLTYNETILEEEKMLKDLVGDVSLDGIDSSYAYVVNSDGTMLYHPNAEKIGQPVENDAVKQILESLNNGVRLDSSVIKYDFKGVRKYAAFYVDEDMSFVVVVTADEKEMLHGVAQMKKKCALYTLLILALLMTVGYVIVNFALKYLNKAKEDVSKMSNLDFSVDSNHKQLKIPSDEIGDILKSVIDTKESIRLFVLSVQDKMAVLNNSISNISNQTGDTSELIDQVERAVGEIASGATHQAEETQEATNNVVSIGNTIDTITNQADDLKAKSEEMSRSEQIASKTLEELVSINVQTKEAIKNIYAQTLSTNESADKIRAAINVITDIADETNLLALNATIEAAHAGESGKGFAVVANHIKQLSEQSNSAAVQIAEIIKDLVKNSNESVKVMDEVNHVIERQTECLIETQKDFETVGVGMAESLAELEEITKYIEQMDVSKNHIIDSVQNLTAIAEENAAGAEETSASATEVSTVMESIKSEVADMYKFSESLKNEISKFKV